MAHPMTDTEYLESGIWKCGDSPTGAHHWLELTSGGWFFCKYCHNTRKFKIRWDEVKWNRPYPYSSEKGGTI